MSQTTTKIYQAILDGDNDECANLVTVALEAGEDPKTILNEGMLAAMAEVGRLFEQGEYFVPEMLISARAMKSGMAVLKPRLKEENVQAAGKVAIGTVKGDLHDIGKNLVGIMLEGAGFEVMDLGTDVTPERFVAAAAEVDLLAFSALLTTTMANMKDTIEALKAAGVREKVKVIVGGAPVTQDFATKIGADGYASDASRAASLAKTLVV